MTSTQPVAKSSASAEQKLNYVEQIAMTEKGLQDAIVALIARRAHADKQESLQIDIDIERTKGNLSRVTEAEILYYAQDVTFRPPRKDDVDAVKAHVDKIDGIIVSQDKAAAIMASVTALLKAFDGTKS